MLAKGAGSRSGKHTITASELESQTRLDRELCVEFLQWLDRIECAEYVVGRRGKDTRAEMMVPTWDVGAVLISDRCRRLTIDCQLDRHTRLRLPADLSQDEIRELKRGQQG